MLYAKSVDGLTFSNNRIVRSTRYQPYHRRKHLLSLEYCRRVQVVGNRLYDPKVTLAPKQELGTVELSPGTHKLTFRLTGSNEQARRFQGKFFMLGLDYMALAPVE